MKQGEEEEAGVYSWLEDWLIEEAETETIAEGTPEFYRLACRFIEATAVRAFNAGDNSLLARAGFAEALEIVTDDVYAGSGGIGFPDFDKEAYAEILEEWQDEARGRIEHENSIAELWRTDPEMARESFWQMFDTDADRDTDAADFRRDYLQLRRGSKLRLLRKSKAVKAELFNGVTDGLIFSHIVDTENPEPARVFVEWLNMTFSRAGEALAQWLEVANIPACERQLADLRAAIKDNFGVFPAPFECVLDGRGNPCIRFTGRELETLQFISRSQARQRGQLADGLPQSGGEVADGGTVINTPLVKIEADKVETPKGAAKGAKRKKTRTDVQIIHAAQRLKRTRQTITNWIKGIGTPKVEPDWFFSLDLLRSPFKFDDWATQYEEQEKRRKKAKEIANNNAVEKALREKALDDWREKERGGEK